METRIHLGSEPFKRALRNTLAHTKREGFVVLREQARGVLRRIINTTPPSNQKHKGKAAHTAGKRTVAAQIGKIMQGVPSKQAVTRDIEGIHAGARVEGRVKGRMRSNRKKVPQRELKAYIRKMQAKVGFLASGWKAAAAKLQISLPQWIAGHSAPGAGEVKTSSSGIKVVMRNAVKYADNISGMTRRIDSALRYQTWAMNNRLRKMMENAAKRAGLGN